MPRVCASACKIHTPLKFKSWQYYLQTHPNQDLVHFFLDGISQGFRIGFNSSTQSLHSAHKTLQGVTLHPEIVYEYLQNKLALNRVCGPYLRHQCSMVQVSRFSVIPKSHQPNKWRLIIDLSYPRRHSVNDHIPKPLRSLSYITVDDAVKAIMGLGPHTLMVKVDIKSAFRLLPVHPADRNLLAMEWGNHIYIDGSLPFGLHSAPKLFNVWQTSYPGLPSRKVHQIFSTIWMISYS